MRRATDGVMSANHGGGAAAATGAAATAVNTDSSATSAAAGTAAAASTTAAAKPPLPFSTTERAIKSKPRPRDRSGNVCIHRRPFTLLFVLRDVRPSVGRSVGPSFSVLSSVAALARTDGECSEGRHGLPPYGLRSSVRSLSSPFPLALPSLLLPVFPPPLPKWPQSIGAARQKKALETARYLRRTSKTLT